MKTMQVKSFGKLHFAVLRWPCLPYLRFGLLFAAIWTPTTEGLKFKVEPHDLIVPQGHSVLLPCEGVVHQQHSRKITKSGPPSVSVRWRGPDGQDIEIADTFRAQFPNGSLYITSLEADRGLTGSYQCVVSADGVGTIVSRSARVSIANLPEINVVSSELYLYPGQTAYFKCLAGPIEYGLKFTVNWFKDDVALLVDESRMTLFASGALEIDGVKSSDGGSYKCHISTGTQTKQSSKTNLNLKSIDDADKIQLPSFLSESSSQIVRDGEAVTLECVAIGVPKPQIKWLRNGEDIDFSDLDSRFRIVGVGSLQIGIVDESDSGNYQCRASNSVDSVDSQSMLEVQVAPKFLDTPQDRRSSEKEEIEMVCSIRGKPTPVIQWLKNGDVIRPNDYMQIVNGHNLRILGLINSDAGMFQCMGSNPAGSVQSSARLQIIEAESHKYKNKLHKPKHLTTKSQRSNRPTPAFDFDDEPITIPRNTQILSKNVFDSLLSNRKNSKQSHATDSYLDDHHFADDSGLNEGDDDYEDEEDEEDDDLNDPGLDVEDEGTIHPFGPNVDPNKLFSTLTQTQEHHHDDTDQFRPDLDSHFKQSPFPTVARNQPASIDGQDIDTSLIPGPPRELQAQIVNPRFVALSWMEPDSNPDEVTSYTVYYKMSTSERERKIITKTRDDQMANIQALLPGRTYLFRVVANSNNGPGESSASFEVSTQPEENISGPPLDLQATAINHTSIHINWKVPLLTYGNITKYRIYYSEDEGAELYTDSHTLEAQLSELRPFTEYTISVVPFNQNGMGDPSNELIVKTHTAMPSEPPINMTIETTSSTSLIVRWEPPPKEEQNGPITGYKIRYRKVKTTGKAETTPGNSRHFELTGLEKLAAYQVKIAAMTINGTGPFTEWSLVETLESDLTETQVPKEPAFIHTKPKANSIEVTWGPPAEQSDIKVRNYILSWGLGIPDVVLRTLDDKTRYYEITDLEPNSEYVISLRAHNRMGDGKPRYETVRTRDDEPLDVPVALEVPVGLRAVTMSANSIVVYWTDTTLNRNQQVVDNRHYTVRYNVIGSSRYKFFNTTDLNCMIPELRPNSQYEFAVKVVKGRRESAWSMSVLNTTAQAVLLSAPRDLTVQQDESNGNGVIVRWSPNRLTSTGGINGYLVYYTIDKSQEDKLWMVIPVNGGETGFVSIPNLTPFTKYYFKAQMKTAKHQYGPFSAMVTFVTGGIVVSHDHGTLGGGSPKFNNETIMYLVIGVAAVVILIAIIVVIVLCRRKLPATPEHAKQSYMKNNAAIKPPDLWIHHDQMELKNVDGKQHVASSSTPGYSDGASSSGAMTLPRSVNHEFEHESVSANGIGGGSHVTNSLDKRSYVPGYMTTSMNSMERPSYPRTQYNSRAVPPHLAHDAASTLSQQNLMQAQQQGGTPGSNQMTPDAPYNYDSMPSNYSNPSVTYAPGLSVDAPKRGQGHPLKSFSVPGPPSTQQLTPNQAKHVPAVTIRPQNASPFKKPSVVSGNGGVGNGVLLSASNRIQQSGPSVAHSTDEIQRLAPSTSTEELNQEMANLEGLMKDLSAITANEFEC